LDSTLLALEVIINLALVVEVTLKVMSLGRSYFQTRSNVFDFVVCVLSVGSLLLFYRGFARQFEKVGDLLVTMLLITRYLLQLLRLIALARKYV
jgi:hypothetical protein